MKKAKFMLAGIACLAIVGGAFAFKATRNATFFYSKTAVNGSCTVPTLISYTTEFVPLAFSYSTRATLVPITTTTAPCPLVTLYSSI